MHGERPCVLIAEGDPELLNALLELLERDGYRVLVARDVTEAVELAVTHHADLLLLDLALPGGGGYRVVEALRARLSEREPGVIFLTSMTQPERIRQGFAVGAVDYITKPFSPAQLRTRVRTWLLRLDRPDAAGGATTAEPEPGPP